MTHDITPTEEEHLWKQRRLQHVDQDFIVQPELTTSRPEERSNGAVTRLVGESLAYLTLDSGTNLCFTPDLILNYMGEAWSELGIQVGTPIIVTWDITTGKVLSITVESQYSEPTPTMIAR